MRAPHRAARVTAVATLLGILAFAADALDGIAGQVAVALVSSGFAWGLAAILTGRHVDTVRRAVTSATGLLAVATVLYYLLILFVSRRWSGAVLADGSPADLAGLHSVAVMTAVWLAGSLLAGPLLGWLGHTIGAGTPRRAALAAGAACGLLSAEGWHAIIQAPPWRLLALGDPFFRGVVVGELIRVTLPLIVLAWLTITHRLSRAWPTLLTAAFATTAAGVMLWQIVAYARGA
ncbi:MULTISPECIES: hypothetical protein [unclassified Micromonospora]|uniref:hypothetical protein n=1 Tax=unclassified Micromonospora TaxID=2617518 RepID=UPI0036265F55